MEVEGGIDNIVGISLNLGAILELHGKERGFITKKG